MKQMGMALNMYGNDYDMRLPAANDSRRHDSGTFRNRLSQGSYIKMLSNSDKDYGYDSIWGCPVAGRRYYSSTYRSSWFLNLGWGGSFDTDGNSISTPDNNPSGNPAIWSDGFDVYIDGRGFNTDKGPDDIVIISDGFAMWFTSPEVACDPISWSNHAPRQSANGIVLPQSSNSLCLSGRVMTRTKAAFRYTADGGCKGYY